jgi:hypothetical protein
MNLLDRYMHSIRTHLPRNLPEAQRDDIISELSENIQAQMDDREGTLGHPLTDAEQEAMLQWHGHPILVAGRYQTTRAAWPSVASSSARRSSRFT